MTDRDGDNRSSQPMPPFEEKGRRGEAPTDQVSEGTDVRPAPTDAGESGPQPGGDALDVGAQDSGGESSVGRRESIGRRVSDAGTKAPPGRGIGQAPFRRVEDQEPKRRGAEVREAIREELAEDRTTRKRRAKTDSVIEMQHVSLAFDEPILEDVSFAAHEGETIVIVGESGTGKSTMLKLILRLLVPEKGQVLVDGRDIAPLSFDEALEVRQKMGMVFQGAALFDSMTVFENVAYPLREHTELTEDEIEERVREKLQFVDLEPDRVMDMLPAELSGGMKKRVGIARGMANNAEIMLYDEPTSGLDPLTTGTITRLIMKLQRELGVTSIVVSHDIRSAFRMATRIAVLAEHHIVFFGTPEDMAASENEYLRDFLGGF
jgi:phospholipid/cholesterol/gamma-HCH transport system ATP-binding protein